MNYFFNQQITALKYKNFCLLFIVLNTVVLHQSFSQNLGNSPYSTYGLGDINYTGLTRNIGMGNVGVSNGHSEFINIINPALLPVNKYDNKDSTVKFTMLDFSLNVVGRTMLQGDIKDQSGGVNLGYFNFLFPLSKNWSTSVGLRPYTSVLNKYIRSQTINDSINTQIEYFSQGSTNLVSFDNGVDINQNFSLGLHLGYIFGSTAHRNTAIFNDYRSVFNPNKLGANYTDFTTAFEIKPGIAYRKPLRDSIGSKRGIYFNAGLTYNLLVNGKTKRSSEAVFVSNINNGKGILDSSLTKTRNYSLNLPQEIAGGISFDKPGKWTVAADFTYSNWSVFKDLYGQSFTANSYTIAIGGEWKPAKNVILTSKEYRAGFSYSLSPISIGGEQLKDYSVSIGASIPAGRKDARFKAKPLNKINSSLVLGTRGVNKNNLVQEYYFRLNFGIVIQDKWFQRWKIN